MSVNSDIVQYVREDESKKKKVLFFVFQNLRGVNFTSGTTPFSGFK